MPSALTSLRRRAKALHRNLRGTAMAARALASTDHPLLAHIIPVRRCNLACTYCNEFDDFSKPVPTEEMFRRIDKLGSLGTAVVTISGGEPLLHPELDDVIYRIRTNGMIAGLITNGYLLVEERIKRLNRAGLEWLQISIDNVNPDDVSKKSLKGLDKKLQLLAEHADFHVNINSVVGSGIHHPQDALVIGKRALELGFTSTIGIIHDGSGQLQPLGEEERRIYDEMKSWEKRSFTRINAFQDNIARGLPNDWRCRAGARYLSSVRMAWFTIARNSAATPACRSPPTRAMTCAVNTSPKKAARRTAPFLVCTRSPSSIASAPHSILRRSLLQPCRQANL